MQRGIGGGRVRGESPCSRGRSRATTSSPAGRLQQQSLPLRRQPQQQQQAALSAGLSGSRHSRRGAATRVASSSSNGAGGSSKARRAVAADTDASKAEAAEAAAGAAAGAAEAAAAEAGRLSDNTSADAASIGSPTAGRDGYMPGWREPVPYINHDDLAPSPAEPEERLRDAAAALSLSDGDDIEDDGDDTEGDEDEAGVAPGRSGGRPKAPGGGRQQQGGGFTRVAASDEPGDSDVSSSPLSAGGASMGGSGGSGQWASNAAANSPRLHQIMDALTDATRLGQVLDLVQMAREEFYPKHYAHSLYTAANLQRRVAYEDAPPELRAGMSSLLRDYSVALPSMLQTMLPKHLSVTMHALAELVEAGWAEGADFSDVLTVAEEAAISNMGNDALTKAKHIIRIMWSFKILGHEPGDRFVNMAMAHLTSRFVMLYDQFVVRRIAEGSGGDSSGWDGGDRGPKGGARDVKTAPQQQRQERPHVRQPGDAASSSSSSTRASTSSSSSKASTSASSGSSGGAAAGGRGVGGGDAASVPSMSAQLLSEFQGLRQDAPPPRPSKPTPASTPNNSSSSSSSERTTGTSSSRSAGGSSSGSATKPSPSAPSSGAAPGTAGAEAPGATVGVDHAGGADPLGDDGVQAASAAVASSQPPPKTSPADMRAVPAALQQQGQQQQGQQQQGQGQAETWQPQQQGQQQGVSPQQQYQQQQSGHRQYRQQQYAYQRSPRARGWRAVVLDEMEAVNFAQAMEALAYFGRPLTPEFREASRLYLEGFSGLMGSGILSEMVATVTRYRSYNEQDRLWLVETCFEVVRHSMFKFGPKSLARLLTAAAVMRYHPDEQAIEAYYARAAELLPDTNLKALRHMLWSMAVLNLELPGQLRESIVARLLELLNADNVPPGDFFFSFTALKIDPGREVLERMSRGLLKLQDERMVEHGLRDMLECYLGLGHTPDPELLREVMAYTDENLHRWPLHRQLAIVYLSARVGGKLSATKLTIARRFLEAVGCRAKLTTPATAAAAASSASPAAAAAAAAGTAITTAAAVSAASEAGTGGASGRTTAGGNADTPAASAQGGSEAALDIDRYDDSWVHSRLVEVLWALACSEAVLGGRLADMLCAYICVSWPDMRPRDAIEAFKCLNMLGIDPGLEVMQQILDSVQPNDISCVQLANLIWTRTRHGHPLSQPTASRIMELLCPSLIDMPGHFVSISAWGLCQADVTVGPQFRAELERATMEKLPTLTAHGLTNLMCAFSKWGHEVSPRLLDMVISEVTHRWKDDVNINDCVHMGWALAKTRAQVPPHVLARAMGHLSANLESLPIGMVINLLYTMVHVEIPVNDPVLQERLLQYVRRQLQERNDISLFTSMTWLLTKLRVTMGEAFVLRFASYVREEVARLVAAGKTERLLQNSGAKSLIWTIVVQQVTQVPSELLDDMLSAVVRGGAPGKAHVDDCSYILNYARQISGYHLPVELVREMEALAHPVLHQLEGHIMARLMWGFSWYGYQPSAEFLVDLEAAELPKLQDMDLDVLAHCLSSWAHLPRPVEPSGMYMEAAEQRCIELLTRSPLRTDGSGSTLQRFTDILNALSMMGLEPNEQLMRLGLQRVLAAGPYAGSSERMHRLVKLLWACTTLGYDGMPPQLLTELTASFREEGPHGLSRDDACLALVILDYYRDSTPYLIQHLKELDSRLVSLSAVEPLTSAQWGLALSAMTGMRYHPSHQLVQAAEQAAMAAMDEIDALVLDASAGPGRQPGALRSGSGGRGSGREEWVARVLSAGDPVMLDDARFDTFEPEEEDEGSGLMVPEVVPRELEGYALDEDEEEEDEEEEEEEDDALVMSLGTSTGGPAAAHGAVQHSADVTAAAATASSGSGAEGAGGTAQGVGGRGGAASEWSQSDRQAPLSGVPGSPGGSPGGGPSGISPDVSASTARRNRQVNSSYRQLVSFLVGWARLDSSPPGTGGVASGAYGHDRLPLLGRLDVMFVRDAPLLSAQNVANVLWCYATIYYDPGQRVVAAALGQLLPPQPAAAAGVGPARPQHLPSPRASAQVLWALGRLARHPGPDMLSLARDILLHQSERCSNRTIGNILYALAVFDALTPDLFCVAARRLSESILGPAAEGGEGGSGGAGEEQDAGSSQGGGADFESEDSYVYMQFFQAYLVLLYSGALSGLPPESLPPSELVRRAQSNWLVVASMSSVSRLHLAVSQLLSELGVAHQLEQRTDDGNFSLDIVIQELKVVIEVDGPFHYTINWPPSPNGATVLRRRMLRTMGWRLVSIPYFLWGNCDYEGRVQLLRSRLEACGVPAAFFSARSTFIQNK